MKTAALETHSERGSRREKETVERSMRNAAHRTAVQRAPRTHSSAHHPAQKIELFLKDVLMFVMERHEPEFPENSNNSPDQKHTKQEQQRNGS